MGMGRWDEIESDMKQEKLKRGSFESDAMWDEGFRRRESTRDRFQRRRLREHKNNETLDIYGSFIKILFEHLISMTMFIKPSLNT